MDHLLKLAQKAYNAGGNPFLEIADIVEYSLCMLTDKASVQTLGSSGGKEYSVFHCEGKYSRPFLAPCFMSSKQFLSSWNLLQASAVPKEMRYSLEPEIINNSIYTALASFASCYDLFKSSSRKTPGTFFEVLMGSIMDEILWGFTRSKHINPPNFDSIATDIVFESKDRTEGLVIPAKITTRERIVQPFAHQRILNSVFGEKAYRSILVAMSETQRDGIKGVNEICVPGPVRLYQAHLAKMEGFYYLDPPTRYLQPDVLSVLPVLKIGDLLASELKKIIDSLK